MSEKTHKRRLVHPYQVMDVLDLSIGAKYAFATVDDDGLAQASFRVMAGVVNNAVGLASSRGWDIPTRIRVGNKIPLAALFADDFGDSVVTVHPDGWYGFENARAHPTLAYWADGHQITWDYLDTFLGPQLLEGVRLALVHTDPWLSAHARRIQQQPHAVVPERYWLADPKLIHISCAPVDAADFERRMRAKRDKMMYGLFG